MAEYASADPVYVHKTMVKAITGETADISLISIFTRRFPRSSLITGLSEGMGIADGEVCYSINPRMYFPDQS